MTPHHLCLTDEAVRSLDPNVKMNPPLRSADDRTALIEGLRDGTIAAVATDHAPHARHEKEVPFEAAPFGVTGLETAFSVALHPPRGAGPRSSWRPCSSACPPGPAQIFGLERPRIEVGAPANLTLIDTAASWRVTEDGFRSRSTNSWLLGETLRGKVRLTVADGRVSVRAVTGFLVLEDGTTLARRVRRGRDVRPRRGRLHDGHDRLPGSRHRPELRRAARLLHGADGRQLRRRRAPERVAGGAREGRDHA